MIRLHYKALNSIPLKGDFNIYSLANRHVIESLNAKAAAFALMTSPEPAFAASSHPESNPFDSRRGMPSTRAQAEGLRVDTERRFLPRFKNRGVWCRRTYQRQTD